ncbi:unnamed protein product [Brugia timori]|uniref:Uncharacterized protein n=1 Tax=Brugia timori TaxID=42155 RepID=A0A0R3QAN5_9BILA|nr:unnamed protein product [Brugia timori]
MEEQLSRKKKVIPVIRLVSQHKIRTIQAEHREVDTMAEIEQTRNGQFKGRTNRKRENRSRGDALLSDWLLTDVIGEHLCTKVLVQLTYSCCHLMFLDAETGATGRTDGRRRRGRNCRGQVSGFTKPI